MKINPLLHLLAVLAIAACSGDSSDGMTTANVEPEPERLVPVIKPTGNERYLNEKSNYLFDQDELRTYELTLPEAHLAELDADPAAERYVEGSLTLEGETISPVGIRYKGSIGAWVGCLSGTNFGNPSGRKTCTKLSMKVKINWLDSDTKFFGVKKLQFHSMNHDDSQMRDRLGYWLFRKMDVATPRAVHARLVINGEFIGLFSLVEQIDGRFTRRNFDDGGGNLYKEIWPLRDNGAPHTQSDYVSALKTNEEERDVSMMVDFAQQLADANDVQRRAVVEQWMNPKTVISYAVVDRAIRNDDGAFHWYCNQRGCEPHNFYWYEEPKARQMHLIPWDLDNAFQNIVTDNNPVTPIADAWGATQNDCEPFPHGSWRLLQRSAACDKLTRTWTQYTDLFEVQKETFLNDIFNEERVNAKLDEWAEQIRMATLEAAQLYPDAVSEDRWNTALNTLKFQCQVARGK